MRIKALLVVLVAGVASAAGVGWWLLTLPATTEPVDVGIGHTFNLPPYTGPLADGKPFPPFAATRADGTPFTDAALRGDRATVLVFFRGRW